MSKTCPVCNKVLTVQNNLAYCKSCKTTLGDGKPTKPNKKTKK